MPNPINVVKSTFFINAKNKIGGYIFDCYPQIQHQLTSTITSHPTQYGADFSDYQYEEPDVLVFQIGMSDTMFDIVNGQFNNAVAPLGTSGNVLTSDEFGDYLIGETTFIDRLKYIKAKALSVFTSERSVNAYKILAKMKLQGIPFDCTTRLNTYHNMLIKDITIVEDNTTAHGLRATVTCQEVLITEVKEVQVQITQQITKTTSSGKKNTFNFDISKNNELTSTWFDLRGLYRP